MFPEKMGCLQPLCILNGMARVIKHTFGHFYWFHTHTATSSRTASLLSLAICISLTFPCTAGTVMVQANLAWAYTSLGN
jgi:hypothetical protein